MGTFFSGREGQPEYSWFQLTASMQEWTMILIRNVSYNIACTNIRVVFRKLIKPAISKLNGIDCHHYYDRVSDEADLDKSWFSAWCND